MCSLEHTHSQRKVKLSLDIKPILKGNDEEDIVLQGSKRVIYSSRYDLLDDTLKLPTSPPTVAEAETSIDESSALLINTKDLSYVSRVEEMSKELEESQDLIPVNIDQIMSEKGC